MKNYYTPIFSANESATNRIKTRSEFHRTAGTAAAADQATPQQTATYADLGLWWWNYRQE